MEQEFNYPKSEQEFQTIKDAFYQRTQESLSKGELPRFKGLMEIAASEVVILTAIHKIKANKGSNTPGSDGKVMRDDYLHGDYDSVIRTVQGHFKFYRPNPVRRKWIDKPGKKEQRPLGIPAVIDRIIQECVRSVIEPILEAQFFKHSYGFRPWRDTHMAMERVKDQVLRVGYHWIIEGDISKFFDNVNHRILLKKLWNMGIRDQRILMIIKEMLQAGVMYEIRRTTVGTPQGGIISPLLANVYLHKLDKWIVREWEEKKTQYEYSSGRNRYQSLHNRTNLKPAYLIRYADDWVLITNTKSNAEKWKQRISKYLETNLKLRLSEEKTLITNIRRKHIHFVGFKYKVKQGKSRTGFVPTSSPNMERFEPKMKSIHSEIRGLRRLKTVEDVIHRINRINSQIRGIINYYDTANRSYLVLTKWSSTLYMAAWRSLRNFDRRVIPANQVSNLLSVHSEYTTKIVAIKYKDMWVGITNPGFCKYRKVFNRSPDETPFTAVGREIHQKRTGKVQPLARADEIFESKNLSLLIAMGKTKSLYNFEYYLNRPYAFNRDKGRCRVCRETIWDGYQVHMHHVNPKLPIHLVNRVPNLATTHRSCHEMIHSEADYSHLGKKVWKKIQDFREKLR
ncbi:group II intron reverse transcriptase/maturase [Brevibacillus sp. NPDC058079]|uniref:group II intron reverse transcriptase/maturase n=1 Tax=Brevibacillus sp. NPDC058079 TaxID=3346330 RepID=UPI0036EB4A3D